MILRPFPAVLAAAIAATACLAPAAANAAESFDNCTGFIDSLPATISTQGVWCLRKHLATGITSGAAITIATNNVTVDCNDFKIGGLQGGLMSQAMGVMAGNVMNATVRNCNIRGFYQGVWLDGSGNLVEHNRLDGNLFVGIAMVGDGNRVQDNRIFDTGGSVLMTTGYGIYANADIVDNVVENVVAAGANTSAYGIAAQGDGTEVSGNRVRGLFSSGTGAMFGIAAQGAAMVVSGNRLVNTNGTGTGIIAPGASTYCTGNVVHGYQTPYSGCDSSAGNLPVVP